MFARVSFCSALHAPSAVSSLSFAAFFHEAEKLYLLNIGQCARGELGLLGHLDLPPDLRKRAVVEIFGDRLDLRGDLRARDEDGAGKQRLQDVRDLAAELADGGGRVGELERHD